MVGTRCRRRFAMARQARAAASARAVGELSVDDGVLVSNLRTSLEHFLNALNQMKNSIYFMRR
jgi:hypothetical protein